MDFVLIEEIVLFENTYEFKVYKYNDEINLNNKEDFVCNLTVLINRVNSAFLSRTDEKVKSTVLVKNLNGKFDNFTNSIRNCIYQEIDEIDLEVKNIEILFCES
ncbi:MAG: hypothetical protein R3Y64_02950 [Peptostreptococcaceae bacterium]